MKYHDPVLLKESVVGLNIKSNGVYVDVTFGGGGHSETILKDLGQEGKLFAFDQDEDAAENRLSDDRFTFIQANFRDLKRFLKLHGVRKVDGVLADLGVSSFQFDEASRGFSYRFEADLDMRMDKDSEQTAITVLKTYSEKQLQELFSKYGEVRNSKTIANAIVAARKSKKILTTSDFLSILEPHIRGNRARYLAQVFQALRIEVNQEMEALQDLLNQVLEILNPEGRLVVISYHSLEDRLVKNFMKRGTFDGSFIKDTFGNIFRPFREINKKIIVPEPEEMKRNPRARSAKLRIAEKIK